MPELPELEVVREVLTRRLVGRPVVRVSIEPKGGPLIVRDLSAKGFAAGITGKQIDSIARRGKFLLIQLKPGSLTLAINPKLSGRLQLCTPDAKKAGPVHVTLHFEEPEEELRYVDYKKMGQLYLTAELEIVPTFTDMGPDALQVSLLTFRQRLRSFRGEIKGVLAREQFLAGVGNAYADEILWAAKIHPYRKRPALSDEEVDRLHRSMQEVLTQAIEKVRRAMGEDVHLKPRDFFAVHMRGGEPCPRCGTSISSITARKRITNFCRTCQPGGLIPGM
jgi:formamidopyrimidine-DNA glycosylase